jgi:hypothetical protein
MVPHPEDSNRFPLALVSKISDLVIEMDKPGHNSSISYVNLAAIISWFMDLNSAI